MNKKTTDTTTQHNKSGMQNARKGKATANNKDYSQIHGDSGKQMNTKRTEKK